MITLRMSFLLLSLSVFLIGNPKKISKVIIPAAGYGTRWLPYTKSTPKELLPLLNKPAAHIIIEECLDAALDHCCFIISEEKLAIKYYFTRNEQTEKRLQAVRKIHLLDEINAIINKTTFTYINQPEMKGLGHAILMAKPFIDHEYFSVVLPDMILFQTQSSMQTMAQIAQAYNATVIAVQKVAPEEIHAYGSIKLGTKIDTTLYEVDDIVEKPQTLAQAPSLYAIIGRYIFSPSIFDALEKVSLEAQGEIQLTDAITSLIKKGERVLAYEVEGKLFDIGRPQGWLAANIHLSVSSSLS